MYSKNIYQGFILKMYRILDEDQKYLNISSRDERDYLGEDGEDIQIVWYLYGSLDIFQDGIGNW